MVTRAGGRGACAVWIALDAAAGGSADWLTTGAWGAVHTSSA
jgi:hypothetical protein